MNKGGLLKATMVLACALAWSGCASRKLEMDFKGYNEAYGETINYQLLLNLARLENGHPPYFLAVGEIRSEHSMGGSIGGNISGSSTTNTNNARTSSSNQSLNREEGVLETVASSVGSAVGRTVNSVTSGGGNLGMSESVSPKFSFIPLNSEDVSKQLLRPVPAEVFYILYDQGWPMDQLLRVVVERIEVEMPDGTTETLANNPRRGSVEDYIGFLRMCEILREYQRAGGLLLEGEDGFTPLANVTLEAPKSGDLITASEKGLEWKEHKDGWVLGKKARNAKFTLAENRVAKAQARLNANPALDGSIIYRNIDIVIGEGLGVRSSSGDRAQYQSRIILRSYNTILESLAQEQSAFEELMRTPDYASKIPENQRRPVLQVRWRGVNAKLAPATTSVYYAGKFYQITDQKGSELNLQTRWNRDVFRLLSQLTSQVAVDISRYQRSVLELE